MSSISRKIKFQTLYLGTCVLTKDYINRLRKNMNSYVKGVKKTKEKKTVATWIVNEDVTYSD